MNPIKMWLERKKADVMFFPEELHDLYAAATATKESGRLLMSKIEAYNIFNLVCDTEHMPGDIAEVGVAKGGSANIICMAKSSSRKLHLFDTFDGLPTPSSDDIPSLVTHKYSANFKDVCDYLSCWTELSFYPGLFNTTKHLVKNRLFSFVHLDADLYQTTKDCLEFFYPRMVKGGVICSHDYSDDSSVGVRKAFDEFFDDKPEVVLRISVSQCIVVKLKKGDD
jgi:hypothetical protein